MYELFISGAHAALIILYILAAIFFVIGIFSRSGECFFGGLLAFGIFLGIDQGVVRPRHDAIILAAATQVQAQSPTTAPTIAPALPPDIAWNSFLIFMAGWGIFLLLTGEVIIFSLLHRRGHPVYAVVSMIISIGLLQLLCGLPVIELVKQYPWSILLWPIVGAIWLPFLWVRILKNNDKGLRGIQAQFLESKKRSFEPDGVSLPRDLVAEFELYFFPRSHNKGIVLEPTVRGNLGVLSCAVAAWPLSIADTLFFDVLQYIWEDIVLYSTRFLDWLKLKFYSKQLANRMTAAEQAAWEASEAERLNRRK